MKYLLATSTWDDKELNAIQSVIDRDMYTMGKSVQKFETNFANFVGSKYAIFSKFISSFCFVLYKESKIKKRR